MPINLKRAFERQEQANYSSIMLLFAAIFVVLHPLRTAASPTDSLQLQAQKQLPSSVEKQPVPFGSQGDNRWYIQGAGAVNIDGEDATFGLLGAGISHFFIDGHSINLELNSLYFAQSDDAVGINLAALLRWHFYRQQNWSLYIDGGAGILGTTNDVPSTGSSFNFTPQVGGGATIELKDEKRLMVGLRWHHISNADLYEGNPGRDSLMGYVGLNFPR